jgi:hypothetical protein
MSHSGSDILKSLAWPTYFVAFLLVTIPLLDFFANVWPLRPGDVQWRYGSLALFTGFMLTPLFGVLFALGAAALREHFRVVRVLSFINVFIALLILILIVFFVLDVVQVRTTVPEEGRSVFDTGAATSMVKYVMMAVALAWLGIAGIRTNRSKKMRRGKRGSPGDVPLVRPDGATS